MAFIAVAPIPAPDDLSVTHDRPVFEVESQDLSPQSARVFPRDEANHLTFDPNGNGIWVVGIVFYKAELRSHMKVVAVLALAPTKTV
jgi:hypothetical protein